MLTASETVFVFLIFSVLGWIIETVIASINYGKFTGRGYLYGPYCPSYGFAMTIAYIISVAVDISPLALLFLSIALVCVLAGLSEIVFRKILDANLRDNRIRRALSIALYTMAGFFVIYLSQPLISSWLQAVPFEILKIISNGFIMILIADLILSLSGFSNLVAALVFVESSLESGQTPVVDPIVQHRLKYKLHLIRAYNPVNFMGYAKAPSYIVKKMQEQKQISFFTSIRDAKKEHNVPHSKDYIANMKRYFNYHHLFWVFMIAGILGYVVETLYCILTNGVLESRQGLLYGPFSQVYGLAAVIMVIFLVPLKHKNDRWIFIGSGLIGGIFEILCSLVQENLFGSVSWDYSSRALGIAGGRTSLIYMIFWGILGVLFIKEIHPRFTKIIDKIPKKQGFTLTSAVTVLMCINIFLSAGAVHRWQGRMNGLPPSGRYGEFLDKQYPDSYMEQVYPNMTAVGKK